MRNVFSFIVLVLTLSGSAFAKTIPVTQCGAVLSAPGKYFLPGDLLSCPGSAITITASDVSLNLKDNEITCERVAGRNDTGILARIMQKI